MVATTRMVARTNSVVRSAPTGARWSMLADAVLTFVVLELLVTASAFAIAQWLDLPALFAWRAAAVCGAAGTAIVWLAARRLARAGFGAANRVTSIRVALAALVAAFVGEPYAFASAWLVVGIATVALLLDGLDGWLARRSHQVTSFGARLDMETDAALTLVLSLLCWQFGKAGIWILAIGLMRYVFVAAAVVAPWLRRSLPYSRRRQTVCVLQLSGLLVVVSPLLPVPASSVVGAATLLLLSISFAIDVEWLARRHAHVQ